jgi:phosphatidylglycerophosphatase A
METMKKILRHAATVGPVGYIPFATGTFGSAVGVLFLALLRPSLLMVLIIAFLLFWIGVLSAHYAELHFGFKDPPPVVIDEFTGMLVSMSFMDINALSLILAFIFFRFFDILKPPPVRTMETMFKGGFGIMLDDIMAGIYANISVQLCTYLLKIW